MTAQIGPHRHRRDDDCPRATLSAYGNKWATGVGSRSNTRQHNIPGHGLYLYIYMDMQAQCCQFIRF